MEKGHAFFRKAQRQRSKKRERSRIFPEGPATGEQKKRKVTHLSERNSDRGAKREKGHAYSRKTQRQRREQREKASFSSPAIYKKTNRKYH